jgi:hypothetical protein
MMRCKNSIDPPGEGGGTDESRGRASVRRWFARSVEPLHHGIGRSSLPFYRLTAAWTVLVVLAYVLAVRSSLEELSGMHRAWLAVRIAIEVLACGYVVSTLLKCADYLRCDTA